MKKFLSILMILALALSMGTMALAADTTYSITVSKGAGHTYNVYQIFTGSFATIDDKETLGDVAFGKNYAADAGETVEEALAALEGKSGAEAAAYLESKIIDEAIAVLNADNNYTTSQVGGYYLIVDVTEKLPEGETSSAFIVQVVGATNIESKHDTVRVTKKVDDTNDSTGAENEIKWQDSADHDIGDLIDFQLTATVGPDFAEFLAAGESYKMILHDTEEKGLTFQPDSVKVYVDNTQITTGYVVNTEPDHDCTFDIVFEDLTELTGVKADSVITVTYQSMLNENAVIGSTGNVNEVYGEYDNFYYPETPVITPKDTVIVFTYKVDVDKVRQIGTNGDGTPDYEALAGAEFTLEKKILVQAADGESEAVYQWKAISVVKTEAGDEFTFNGLDDGDYRLTETVTPAGYNTIEPIEFTVTAAHAVEWTDQNRNDVLTGLTGNVATGAIEFTPDLTNGSLSTKVVNQKGVVLPETGGMGTTVFYALGGVLVLAAVVLLVTKKRMKAEG